MALGVDSNFDVEGSEEAIFSDINITPLTDIFLVLVIILIISGSAAVDQVKQEQIANKSAGLKIKLPSGEAREIDPGSKSLVVVIQQDGSLTMKEKIVSETDLDRIFMAAFSRNKDTQVILRADAGVNHGRVVGIMERAKRVGLSHLAIATAGE